MSATRPRTGAWARLKRIWMATGLTLTVVFIGWSLLAFRASAEARAATASDSVVANVRADGVWWFTGPADSTPPSVGLLFFAGAMVDPTAYAPLARAVAAAGFPTVLVELPRRGVFGGADDPDLLGRALDQMRKPGQPRRWVIGGHSRGAVVAADLAAMRSPNVVGVVFVGTTHPRDVDLSGLQVPVAKLIGTKDGIAPERRSNENRHLLPAATRWIRIEGGNHSQFGWYGFQPGDRFAEISAEEQRAQMLAAILEMLRGAQDSVAPIESPAPSVAEDTRVDHPVGWTLARRWSVGGARDDALVLSTLFAKDVATDAQGRLLVVDRTESRIVAFDSLGNRIRTLGRKGLGPGELSAPLAVDVVASGAIHVYDAAKTAVVVFGEDGRVLPEYRVPRRLHGLRHLPDERVVGVVQRGDTVRLVAVTSDSALPLVTQVRAPTRSTPPVCGLTDYPASPVFAPELAWAAREGLIVASTGSFAITVFEGTARQRVLTRGTAPRRSTRALARQHLGPGEKIEILGERACTVPADLLLSVADVAPTLPAYEALVIAPDRRIWATRFSVRGEPGMADIYDPLRGYLGTVPLGSARPVAFLSTGAMVSLEPDPEDVPQLVVYAVRRP